MAADGIRPAIFASFNAPGVELAAAAAVGDDTASAVVTIHLPCLL
jgi:hypothetical protein